MVYSNKFVVCILLNGNVQEELKNGVVNLPFGSEYAIRLRNKHSRRAVVKLYIDGENVSGGGYVINANDHVDIQRHHDKDRAFKFVDLNSPEAVDAGKNGSNDDKQKGVIEARFYLEKERPKSDTVHVHHHHYKKQYIYPPYWDQGVTWIGGPQTSPIWYNSCGTSGLSNSCDVTRDATPEISCSAGGTQSSLGPAPTSYNAAGPASASLSSNSVMRSQMTRRSIKKAGPARDGATVEGGTTGQNFRTVSIELEEEYTSLKVYLQGFDTEEVETPEIDRPNKPIVAHWNPAIEQKLKRQPESAQLELENEQLRKRIAELENEQLRKRLEELESK